MTPAAGTPALVGRDAELATARLLLDASGAGEGGLLLVTGEAGIGKSRFLAEVASLARSSGRAVLTGRPGPRRRHLSRGRRGCGRPAGRAA